MRSQDFQFRTRVARELNEGADDLFILLVFERPVLDDESVKLTDFIDEFSDKAYDARVLNYHEGDYEWGRNHDRVEFFWDIGYQKPELTPILQELFSKVNDIVPIRRIRLHCGLD